VILHIVLKASRWIEQSLLAMPKICRAYGAISGIARGAADPPKTNEIASVAMANRTGPGDVFLDRLRIAGVRDFSRAGDCHFECVGN